MKYRQLGASDLKVSEISLGSWLTYGAGVEREHTEACTKAAFEAGINFFDTANVYGRGAAEEFLGEVLRDRPRDSYVLATKLYFPMDDSGENQGLSRAQVLKQIDAVQKTVAAFEERMASLDGGIGAVATASGQSAEFLTLAALCETGDEHGPEIGSRGVYCRRVTGGSGTQNQQAGVLCRHGILVSAEPQSLAVDAT